MENIPARKARLHFRTEKEALACGVEHAEVGCAFHQDIDYGNSTVENMRLQTRQGLNAVGQSKKLRKPIDTTESIGV